MLSTSHIAAWHAAAAAEAPIAQGIGSGIVCITNRPLIWGLQNRGPRQYVSPLRDDISMAAALLYISSGPLTARMRTTGYQQHGKDARANRAAPSALQYFHLIICRMVS